MINGSEGKINNSRSNSWSVYKISLSNLMTNRSIAYSRDKFGSTVLIKVTPIQVL